MLEAFISMEYVLIRATGISYLCFGRSRYSNIPIPDWVSSTQNLRETERKLYNIFYHLFSIIHISYYSNKYHKLLFTI